MANRYGLVDIEDASEALSCLESSKKVPTSELILLVGKIIIHAWLHVALSWVNIFETSRKEMVPRYSIE